MEVFLLLPLVFAFVTLDDCISISPISIIQLTNGRATSNHVLDL